MGVSRKDQQPELMPMAIAALVAAVSVAALLLLDFAPNNSQGNADGMITSAVLARAGAIATPSERPTNIAIPETIKASEPPRP
jgi:hypothetical protein